MKQFSSLPITTHGGWTGGAKTSTNAGRMELGEAHKRAATTTHFRCMF